MIEIIEKELEKLDSVNSITCPECNNEMLKITDGFKCFQCGIEVFPRIR